MIIANADNGPLEVLYSTEGPGQLLRWNAVRLRVARFNVGAADIGKRAALEPCFTVWRPGDALTKA